jgi:hypothetical protein
MKDSGMKTAVFCFLENFFIFLPEQNFKPFPRNEDQLNGAIGRGTPFG